MFKIRFSPLATNESLTLSKQGESLTINGETFDFSQMTDGARLPFNAIQNEWLGVDDITKQNGVISITIRNPLPAHTPEEYWKIITVEATQDGEIPVPVYPPKEVKPNA